MSDLYTKKSIEKIRCLTVIARVTYIIKVQVVCHGGLEKEGPDLEALKTRLLVSWH